MTFIVDHWMPFGAAVASFVGIFTFIMGFKKKMIALGYATSVVNWIAVVGVAIVGSAAYSDFNLYNYKTEHKAFGEAILKTLNDRLEVQAAAIQIALTQNAMINENLIRMNNGQELKKIPRVNIEDLKPKEK